MDIGIVGLGAMGKNLALNFHRNKFKVAIYNRTHSKAKAVADELKSESLKAYESVSDFVASLVKTSCYRPPRSGRCCRFCWGDDG